MDGSRQQLFVVDPGRLRELRVHLQALPGCLRRVRALLFCLLLREGLQTGKKNFLSRCSGFARSPPGEARAAWRSLPSLKRRRVVGVAATAALSAPYSSGSYLEECSPPLRQDGGSGE